MIYYWWRTVIDVLPSVCMYVLCMLMLRVVCRENPGRRQYVRRMTQTTNNCGCKKLKLRHLITPRQLLLHLQDTTELGLAWLCLPGSSLALLSRSKILRRSYFTGEATKQELQQSDGLSYERPKTKRGQKGQKHKAGQWNWKVEKTNYSIPSHFPWCIFFCLKTIPQIAGKRRRSHAPARHQSNALVGVRSP